MAFGGTTGIWGGRCVPFDPIDFESRDYVSNSGWPISYDEVRAALIRARSNIATPADSISRHRAPSREGRPTIPGLRSEGVLDLDLIERYSLPTNFGKRYRQRIRASGNVTAVVGARCIELVKAEGEERIDGVRVALQSGALRLIRAAIVVLAAGGIESVRLLLASDPNGIGLGNGSDCLGRFYACHLEGTLGTPGAARGRCGLRFREIAGTMCIAAANCSSPPPRSAGIGC